MIFGSQVCGTYAAKVEQRHHVISRDRLMCEDASMHPEYSFCARLQVREEESGQVYILRETFIQLSKYVCSYRPRACACTITCDMSTALLHDAAIY